MRSSSSASISVSVAAEVEVVTGEVVRALDDNPDRAASVPNDDTGVTAAGAIDIIGTDNNDGATTADGATPADCATATGALGDVPPGTGTATRLWSSSSPLMCASVAVATETMQALDDASVPDAPAPDGVSAALDAATWATTTGATVTGVAATGVGTTGDTTADGAATIAIGALADVPTDTGNAPWAWSSPCLSPLKAVTVSVAVEGEVVVVAIETVRALDGGPAAIFAAPSPAPNGATAAADGAATTATAIATGAGTTGATADGAATTATGTGAGTIDGAAADDAATTATATGATIDGATTDGAATTATDTDGATADGAAADGVTDSELCSSSSPLMSDSVAVEVEVVVVATVAMPALDDDPVITPAAPAPNGASAALDAATGAGADINCPTGALADSPTDTDVESMPWSSL
jgi:hypothetical protein